jgi:CubicO group peptidase (beta-lactamase class C family)
MLVLAGCATGDITVSAPSNLRATLAHTVDRYRICGAVVAVVKDRMLGAVEAASGCETLDPPRQDAVFQAASLSKPVFAYAVLKLVEQGKLALDTPVLTYLPKAISVGLTRLEDRFARAVVPGAWPGGVQTYRGA